MARSISGARRAVAAAALALAALAFANRGNTAVTEIPRAGLDLWLRADQGVQLSGPNVTEWDDAVTGIHAVKAGFNNAPATNPRLVPNAAGGKPVLRFDGSDTYFSFPRLADIRSVFWVLSKDPASLAGNVEHERCVLGDDGFGLLYNADFLPGSIVGRFLLHANVGAIYLREGLTRLNGKLVDGTAAEYPAALGVVSFLSTGHVQASKIGFDRTYPGRGWWGDIAEIILYNRVLADSERAEVEAYLFAKYGIAGQDNPAPASEAWSAAVAAGAAPTSSLKLSRYIVVAALALSPDGKSLASASDAVRIWDVTSGSLLRTQKELPGMEVHGAVPGQPGQYTRLAYSPDGSTLAACSTDRKVTMWDKAGAAIPLKGALGGVGIALWGIAFPPGGKSILVNSRDPEYSTRKYDLAGGAEIKYLAAPPGGWSGRLWGVAVSADGKWAASSDEVQNVRVWNAATGAFANTLATRSVVFQLAFSPDGKTLAAGCANMALQLWDVASGQLRKTLYGHGAALLSVAYSPDGRFIATGSDDGTVRIWDAIAGAGTRTINAHAGGVWSVVFAADGLSLFTGGGDLLIKRWDLQSGRMLQTLGSSDGIAVPGGLGHALSPAPARFDLRGRRVRGRTPNLLLYAKPIKE